MIHQAELVVRIRVPRSIDFERAGRRAAALSSHHVLCGHNKEGAQMTTTTRSAECNAPGTLVMLAFDLGSMKWMLGFTTAPAQHPRIRTMPAGDLGTLVKEIQLAKARFGLPLGSPVRSCYEAGRDGFWPHRWLLVHAVENVVVDSSSIEVNRRARRAKTDRLDVSKLLALLLRWHGGERKV
jgi:hypothetical protein